MLSVSEAVSPVGSRSGWTTVLIFWAAHVYSHGFGESLNLGRPLTARELGDCPPRITDLLAGCCRER